MAAALTIMTSKRANWEINRGAMKQFKKKKTKLGFIIGNWECFNPGMTRLGSLFWRMMLLAAWQRESETLINWTPGTESCREGHQTVGAGTARSWRVISQGWTCAWGYGDKMPLTKAYTWRSPTRPWRKKSWVEGKGKWVSQLFLLCLKHFKKSNEYGAWICPSAVPPCLACLRNYKKLCVRVQWGEEERMLNQVGQILIGLVKC